jgi:exosortase
MLAHKKLIVVGLVASGFAVLYWPVLAGLVGDWATDDNYSHGFLVAPLAGLLVWERRARLASERPSPRAAGLVLVLASIGLLACGVLGSELFLTRISLIGTLAGITVYLAGWRVLRVLTLPLTILLLMVPLPAIIFNQITFPLQLFASRAGEHALRLLAIPVLREGNVLVLASTTLEVAEACSGIRSLVSLLTLGIAFGYYADPRAWARTLIALSSIPVAIAANAARVAGTGIAAHHLGPAAAEGFLHSFSGWIVFIVAALLMFALQRFVAVVAPPTCGPSRRSQPGVAVAW